MTYVITDLCTKDANCVAVCPVDCIQTSDEDDQYFVDPNECIDCGACTTECEFAAVFAEDDLPEEKREFIQINADFFRR